MMDYELIYKTIASGCNTDSEKNIEINLTNKARKQAAIIHEKYLEFLEKNLDKNTQFEVSSTACMANNIMMHVYTWKPGDTTKTCCFCGCTDD